jgi:hypothetical protein
MPNQSKSKVALNHRLGPPARRRGCNLVNDMQALGSGRVTPRQGVSGTGYDPAMEQGAISQTEAEAFNDIHDRLVAAGLTP